MIRLQIKQLLFLSYRMCCLLKLELKNTFTIEENRLVIYLDLQIQGDRQLKCQLMRNSLKILGSHMRRSELQMWGRGMTKGVTQGTRRTIRRLPKGPDPLHQRPCAGSLSSLPWKATLPASLGSGRDSFYGHGKHHMKWHLHISSTGSSWMASYAKTPHQHVVVGPAHGRGLGTGWSFRSLPTQISLWFILWFYKCHV